MTAYANARSTKRARRLNGWHRIGIIASSLWMIGSIVVDLHQRSLAVEAAVNSAYKLCDATNHELLRDFLQQGHPYKPADCWATWQQSYAELTPIRKGEWLDYVLVSTGQVALTWIGAYLVVWTTRWISRGFGR